MILLLRLGLWDTGITALLSNRTLSATIAEQAAIRMHAYRS
jgi:hypothetical protein